MVEDPGKDLLTSGGADLDNELDSLTLSQAAEAIGLDAGLHGAQLCQALSPCSVQEVYSLGKYAIHHSLGMGKASCGRKFK